jgi:hypothetical protein
MVAKMALNTWWERRFIHIGDREALEERMDELERQMGRLREQMQRTLGGIEYPDRRGPPALRRFLGYLPNLPGRARNSGDRSEGAAEHSEGPVPTPAAPDRDPEAQETAELFSDTREVPVEERRGFGSKLFGG